MPKKARSVMKRVPTHSFSRYYCPDEQYVTFRYPGRNTVAATGGYYLYQFRGNSPYDCDYTLTGAQPPGFDQWSGLYKRYRVYEYSITLRVVSSTANSSVSAAIWSTPGVAPVSPGFDDAAGNRFSVRGTASTGGPPLVLHTTVNVAKLWGYDPSAVEIDDNFDSGVTTNPNRVCYVSFVFDSGSTDTFTFDWDIRMKTKLNQPVDLSLSATRLTPQLPGLPPASEDAAGHGHTITSEHPRCACEAVRPHHFPHDAQACATPTSTQGCFHPNCTQGRAAG